MPKRNKWTTGETLEMLSIMQEQESLKAMNGRPFRKDKAFRFVQEEMVSRGYHYKDPKQIEYRWKNLKRQYTDLQKDPSLAETRSFIYFDEIDQMIRGKTSKPSVSNYNEIKQMVQRKTSEVSVDNYEEIDQMIQNKTSEISVGNYDEIDHIMEEKTSEVSVTNYTEIDQMMHEKTSEASVSNYDEIDQMMPEKTSIGNTRLIELNISKENVLQNQKLLIDYQYSLYSKLHEESDQKFLDMSRQMLEECNERFQVFMTKFNSDALQ
ncbi:uncharacterized protein LOC128720389 [Anopheles nili]|uniref:uncharacterized protein LOC128720389 n=1 Tax=Anopheles nili TaxID=185578 RepID=UPI00237BEF83|nr:uncharacterized protein LOC128720389 [Anopheles nili]